MINNYLSWLAITVGWWVRDGKNVEKQVTLAVEIQITVVTEVTTAQPKWRELTKCGGSC